MRRRLITALAVGGISALLAGCASAVDGLPPSLETLRVLREQAAPPMALGSFTAASKEVGRTVSIRLSTMHAPKGHSYADFLGQTFATELGAAGKLDPAANISIEGVLTESHVGENMATGQAVLGARITLLRGGTPVLAKPYRVEATWHSDFIGAIAIPEAFRQYNALYALLVRRVLSDPEMIAAAKQ